MKVYKLTDSNGQTKNATQWGENISHEAPGTGELCSRGWLHYYNDPHLAIIFNPIHAGFPNPELWEAEAEGEIKTDKGLQFGCTKLTTIKEIDMPILTTAQLIAFVILCSREVYKEDKYIEWADNWLSGKDRSARAARAAEAAARPAARAAEAAAWAAQAAAQAAEAAAEAAWADIAFLAILKLALEY